MKFKLILLLLCWQQVNFASDDNLPGMFESAFRLNDLSEIKARLGSYVGLLNQKMKFGSHRTMLTTPAIYGLQYGTIASVHWLLDSGACDLKSACVFLRRNLPEKEDLFMKALESHPDYLAQHEAQLDDARLRFSLVEAKLKDCSKK